MTPSRTAYSVTIKFSQSSEALGLAVRMKNSCTIIIAVKVILKYKYYAIRNNCVLERRLTR